MYARIENGRCVEYPVLEKHIVARRHRIEDYVPVAATEKPLTPKWQKVRQGWPVLSGGQWRQSWIAYDSPPDAIRADQIRIALLYAGLLDDFEAKINVADKKTRIEWDHAPEVRRDWPGLQLLGMTKRQLGELFMEGAKL